MKRISLIVLLILCGCGHNRFNEYRSTGATVVIPMGDLGALGIGIGSTEYTTAMVRGGSSFTTETAAGAGIFSGAAGSSRITTFKSNPQLNEGNLADVMSDPNVPDKVKLDLADGMSKTMKAPDLSPSVLQTREAVIYSNGHTNEFAYPFGPTGIDRVVDNATCIVTNAIDNIADTTKDVVDNVVDTSEEVVKDLVDVVDSTTDAISDTADSMSKGHAWATIGLTVLAVLLILAKSFYKANKGEDPPPVSAPPPPTDDVSPPDIEDDDTPVGDESPQPEPPPQKNKTPMEIAFDAFSDVFRAWDSLSDDKKDMIKKSASTIVARKPKK